MNYNIFSPKGKIDGSTFVLYYVLLMCIYFVVGFLIFPKLLLHRVNLVYPNLLFIIMNLLILFNYKKKLSECFKNPVTATILATVLTFDHLFIPFVLQHPVKTIEAWFYLSVIFVFCIQPAIAIALPVRNK